MMQLDPVVCVESVWNSTIRHISATTPPPIKVIFIDYKIRGYIRDDAEFTFPPKLV